MAGCAFCAVLRRETAGSFLFEDDCVAAFLDLYPVHEGHTLVVPKRHAVDLVDCPPDLVGRLFEVCAILAPAVVAAVGADGFNVWTANGRAAGQTVFHLHLHILPRFSDDTFGLRFPRNYPQEAARGDLESVAARIRGVL